MSPWALHHDARFFSDPFAFKPERWLDGSAAAAPKNAYLPFGAGPRVCVGNHFAMMEAVLVLATILQRARFERTRAEPVRTMTAVVLRPAEPIPMRVVARDATRVAVAPSTGAAASAS
jgi:cytochrome P450